MPGLPGTSRRACSCLLRGADSAALWSSFRMKLRHLPQCPPQAAVRGEVLLTAGDVSPRRVSK